jgi:uncharacterized protein YgbK (DUF1537 family)
MQEDRKPHRIASKKAFADLPPEWPVDLLAEIKERIAGSGSKVVVLDDDPTGTQTVHGIPVLTHWSADELQAELSNELPAFFLLTNSRSLPLMQARSINAGIGRKLMTAAKKVQRRFVLVSRSDSTLRGHFPAEVDALAATLESPPDACIITPFFPEGGRYTIDDTHFVEENEWLVPVGETEFARDPSFGYRASNLRRWVEEKTGGRISSTAVSSLSIEELREKGPESVASFLARLRNGRFCVANAASYRDLEVLVLGILKSEARGKQFIYRTAASFVRVRCGLSVRPPLAALDLKMPAVGGGLVVVGSCVPKTTVQLNRLLSRPGIAKAEIEVDALLGDARRRLAEIRRVSRIADHGLRDGRDTVIHTSRRWVAAKDEESSLNIGRRISQGIIACLKDISTPPRFIIAKGGITASDVATEVLKVKRAVVCGQILPGVPVWRLGGESRYPGLAYIVFPGNVGGADALMDVLKKLLPQ